MGETMPLAAILAINTSPDAPAPAPPVSVMPKPVPHKVLGIFSATACCRAGGTALPPKPKALSEAVISARSKSGSAMICAIMVGAALMLGLLGALLLFVSRSL